MPTILRRIDWLNIGIGPGQRAERRVRELNTPDFVPGTRNLAVRDVVSRPKPSGEAHSLTRLKTPFLSPVARVPAFHPYFAALLREREECETMRRHRFDVFLILEPHV